MIKMKMLLLVSLACLFACLVSGAYPGYQLSNLNKAAYGYQGQLSLLGAGPYGSDIQSLSLQVYYQTQDILRIKISDPNNKRWEVPNINQLQPPTSTPAQMDYKISFVEKPFGFAITRVSNGDTIFNTSSTMFNPMLFEDQYLEISTTLPNNPNIYGIGERVGPFKLPTGNTYTIWNRDVGTPTMVNLYGTHPFYLEMRSTGLAHGVFILNSNAQDWVLQNNYLTYKSIGGIFDIFVFLGSSPASVIQQYHSVIGTPYLPPYWGLGWHQCRYGYHTLAETMEVVGNYSKFNIPLDTMWNDIDYMDAYKDFTNDPTRFPQAQVRQFVKQLHSNGQHYIMIIDPGIAIDSSYSTYNDLLAIGAHVNVSGSNTAITGKVWPGAVIFPDFLNPASTDFWYNQAAAFHAVGPEFDGMWIDMNEISNFCDGQCSENESIRKTRMVISDHESKPTMRVGANYNNPPYLPGGQPLSSKTVNVTAQQTPSIMYNTHNLYGWSEGIASKLAMEKLRGTRSVVISRSTFAGSGHHNGHWLGDNVSTFQYLYNSIAGVLTMQLFGVNFVGADICGFSGDTTAELCARWMQLGSLYPFSRNHNVEGARSQEPYAFGQPLINISIAALNTRYMLLPYYYTLFASAHKSATTVWRPLFFEFPMDSKTYGIDSQFMVGPYILASPVLTQGATSVSAYFPAAVWYELRTGDILQGTGANVNLAAPLTYMPIHVRGGGIIPTQGPALTTTAARKNPFGLIVTLDTAGKAQGDLYLDDGESLDPIQQSSYLTFSAMTTSSSSGTLQSTVVTNSYTMGLPSLQNVTFYGIQSAPTAVTANNSPTSFVYVAATKVLKVTVSLPIVSAFTVKWS